MIATAAEQSRTVANLRAVRVPIRWPGLSDHFMAKQVDDRHFVSPSTSDQYVQGRGKHVSEKLTDPSRDFIRWRPTKPPAGVNRPPLHELVFPSSRLLRDFSERKGGRLEKMDVFAASGVGAASPCHLPGGVSDTVRVLMALPSLPMKRAAAAVGPSPLRTMKVRMLTPCRSVCGSLLFWSLPIDRPP